MRNHPLCKSVLAHKGVVTKCGPGGRQVAECLNSYKYYILYFYLINSYY